ncbi:MAG: 6-phosphogluconolactonase [Porphyromonadaceae bacterium]|nr:MAG: 6-phosphogluconolactonase [Porphyromonadaceae bacterium]
MQPIIKIFPSLNKLTDYFISRISDHLINKSANQFFSIALSGGSTPRAIFKLITTNYKNEIDWSKVLVFWGDERCVPPSDEESNYRMAYETLLKHLNIPELNIYRIKGENDPEEEAKRYSEIVNKSLQHVNNIPQFDLIILGLGEDGHTASIFPYNIDLFYSDNLFEISEHPITAQKRITATGCLINNAKEVCFIVTGSGKAKKVAQILLRKEGWQELPASLVDPAGGQVVWMMDQDAGIGI